MYAAAYTTRLAGLGMYQTLYAVVINDYPSALEHLVTTLEIAAAIAIGMLMITSIYKAIKITKLKALKHIINN